MKKLLNIFFLPIIFFFQFFFFTNIDFSKEVKTLSKDSVSYASISLVGDLMCHSTQFNYSKAGPDSFDFTGVYRFVKNYLSNADLAIGNLETVTAGNNKSYSGYPFFNSPDDFITALKYSGFDVLITANNHAIDQGEKGVIRTIDQILKNGMNYSGTFSSQSDRDSVRIYNINGINISILSYSENTNGLPLPKGKNYLINLIDTLLIRQDIQKARQHGADIIMVDFHFGVEYQREPNSYQKEIVNKTIEAGADLIIGSHPHVIQPMNFYRTINGTLDSGLVAYSLGNFISNQRWRYSDAGVILSIKLAKNLFTDSVYLQSVNYIPTWVFKGSTGRKNEYIILPRGIDLMDSSYSFLSSKDLSNMKEAFEDTDYIMNLYLEKNKFVKTD